jgi:hypothetical protein
MPSCYNAQLLNYDYPCTARRLHLFYENWVFHWYISHLKNLITQEDMSVKIFTVFFGPLCMDYLINNQINNERDLKQNQTNISG